MARFLIAEYGIEAKDTMKRSTLIQAVCASLLAWAMPSTQALAQTWPSKPIRIVIPFAAGGSTDAIARILGQTLTQTLGQPILVDNKPGADGAIAGDFVAKAEPDGHTFFLATNSAMMQATLLRKNPPYDTLKSFTPVSLVGRYVYVLVVNPTLPVNTAQELLSYARSNPGKLAYGSYSGVTQLMHARLKSVGADMTLVPYKGEAPTVTDILGNHVQLTFATPQSTQGHIKDGKLRALAMLLPNRSAQFPNVPTALEAGLPPFTTGTWATLLGPANLPPGIVQRMNRELNAALQKPDVREKISNLGFEVAGSSPEEMGSYLKDQLEAWGKAFKEAGMQPE